VVVEGSPFSPPPTLEGTNPCPYEATRAQANDFGSIFDFGWFYMNLNTSTGSVVDPIKQSFVTTVHSASGLFSVGYQAVHLDSALAKTFTVTTAPSDVILPILP
jgi:transposase InsO family protein